MSTKKIKKILTITQAAVEQIRLLINNRNKPTLGIKLVLTTKGCSGLKYKIEYADKIEVGDQVVEQDGVKLVIDPKALMFVIGTKMDFVKDSLKSGFVFINPNEKGRCGCGESFYV